MSCLLPIPTTNEKKNYTQVWFYWIKEVSEEMIKLGFEHGNVSTQNMVMVDFFPNKLGDLGSGAGGKKKARTEKGVGGLEGFEGGALLTFEITIVSTGVQSLK